MYFSHGIGWTRSRNLDGMTRTRCLSYGILCSVPPKAKNRETEVSRGFRFFVSRMQNHQKSVHKFVNMEYCYYLCTQNRE